MYKKLGLRLLLSLARFTQIQLFITTISLPIITCWGLPISLLTLVGNLIFGPVLTLFLILSAVIFFFELLMIPNHWLIMALELVTSWWLAIIACASRWWLWYFPQPSVTWCLVVPACALFIIHYRQTRTLGRSIVALTVLIIVSLSYLVIMHKPTQYENTIACNKGALILSYDHGSTLLIDPGYLGQRLSAPSWVEFTLLPTLVKRTGSSKIDHLIALQPTKITFEALTKLLSLTTITKLYLPFWQGTLPPHVYRAYKQLVEKAKQAHCSIIRFGSQELIIDHGNTQCLRLRPMHQTFKVYDAHYPAYALVRHEISSSTIIAQPIKIMKPSVQKGA